MVTPIPIDPGVASEGTWRVTDQTWLLRDPLTALRP
jgi:hypothetical protein